MPELVTLGSVGYNPYNDTFARFAMQGLQMGMQMMEHKDNLAQRQSEQLSNQISESTNNLYKGVEMQMRNKELNHRMENDKFNQMLDTEKFKFAQTSFWKDIAMKEDERDYTRKHDAEVDDPYKKSITASNELRNEWERDTWSLRMDEAIAKVDAEKQANEFNRATQAARITSANMAPTVQAMGIAKEAQMLPYVGPKAAQEIEESKAQTAQYLGRAEYLKGGGASRDKAFATASSVSYLVNSQDKLMKEESEIGAALAGINKTIQNTEKALKGKMSDDTRKAYEERLKGLKGEVINKQATLDGIKAQREGVNVASDETIRQYNDYLIKQGKTPIDSSNMSPEQKRAEVLKLLTIMQKENAANSGMLPGSQSNPTPADQAASAAAAGQPIGTPSRNPPTSKFDALNFGSLDTPSPGSGKKNN